MGGGGVREWSLLMLMDKEVEDPEGNAILPALMKQRETEEIIQYSKKNINLRFFLLNERGKRKLA